jgi:hypothetical protein
VFGVPTSEEGLEGMPASQDLASDGDDAAAHDIVNGARKQT